MDPERLAADQLFDHRGRIIAPLNTNYFRWRAQTLGKQHQIAISTHHGCETGLSGPLKDERVRSCDQIVIVDAFQTGKGIRQLSNQLRGEVLVEQNPHA